MLETENTSTDFFDNLSESISSGEAAKDSKKELERREEEYRRRDMLIYQTFMQTEYGTELLEIWKQALMLAPSGAANGDAYEMGKSEGLKQFIRNIIKTIEKVQNNDH